MSLLGLILYSGYVQKIIDIMSPVKIKEDLYKLLLIKLVIALVLHIQL